MEEFVGALWDRIVKRAARRDYPESAVRLEGIENMLGVLFRALGGDAGLRVTAAALQRHGARRRFLERIAGSGERSPRAALDGLTLRLPEQIALFAQRDLNRDLYLWLIAAAAHQSEPTGEEWIVCNQSATRHALLRYPGLVPRYQRLVAALLIERMAPAAMPADEALQECAVRQALLEPGSVTGLPPLQRARAKQVQPVPLWIYPAPGVEGGVAAAHTPRSEGGGSRKQEGEAERKRYQAQRTETPDNESPLILPFRAESILSWAEYVKVNRALDDDENPDAARTAANMDQLSVAADNGEQVASKVRFDLDLPSAAEDDAPLGDGIALPEWDFRRHELKPDYCRLQRLVARGADPVPLPEHLRRPARKLRNQFAALSHARRWQKAQPDGSELDIDACVRLHADRLAGQRLAAGGAYMSLKRQERDLACLVLADLSLSTDAWVSDTHRIIDVIRDSLMLFGEALSATGDRFGFYGFSSLKRGNVRFHEIKDFAGAFGNEARGRIAALKPGYYTRMGAAIRHASTVLGRQPASMRLLLLLSDGKPHDMDIYEGRYGIEDTRKSLVEARKLGIKPFCVTIDREGASYLPHLFGPGGFTVLRKPEDLPTRLPLLYAQLTRA